MGTFGKVKKYSKPSLSLEIEEKAKLLEKELEKFLEFDFFPRSGGGIGMQRLMTALS